VRLALLATALIATLAAGPDHAASNAPPCTATQLRGTFRVVSGSAGAGNVVYRLRLENRSRRRCSVVGLPHVRLLSRAGAPLPTRVRAARPRPAKPHRVVLRPGQGATASARFSPDVPGLGEPRLPGGRCEPVAGRLRVVLHREGAFSVLVSPPTSVCEHGALQFTVYERG